MEISGPQFLLVMFFVVSLICFCNTCGGRNGHGSSHGSGHGLGDVMAEVEVAVEGMGEAEVVVVEAVEVMGEVEVNKVCLLTGPSQNRFKKSNTLFKEPETSQLMILMSLLSNVT